ncbi:TPA: transposase domain-containing protein [Escherichia coli]|nr:transposase domain-containing protein [Escherichia coli]HAW7738928.1 transposase domain-containing protein [Escherichia coli]
MTIDDCWKGWAILLRQKQKKLIMLPSETMIWQPEFTDKTLSRKPGAVQYSLIGTCKLNGVEPESYLRYVLDVIADWPINRVGELLPWRVALPTE